MKGKKEKGKKFRQNHYPQDPYAADDPAGKVVMTNFRDYPGKAQFAKTKEEYLEAFAEAKKYFPSRTLTH